jgi:hypothetical protein
MLYFALLYNCPLLFVVFHFLPLFPLYIPSFSSYFSWISIHGCGKFFSRTERHCCDLAMPLLHFNSFSSRKLDFIPLSYEVERTSKIVYSLDLVIGVLLVDRLCTAKFFRAQHQLREKLDKARHRVCPSWWLKTQRTISKKRKDS